MMEAFERIAPPHAAVAVPDNVEVADLKERLARLEALLASQAKAPATEGRRA
jgi:hypothetical protein